MGEREWYLMSWRDRKYARGLRRNRATGAGHWKATGKDREVYSGGHVVGMKKTLVFYKGRTPRGHKTKWLMHEYRLHPHFSTSKAEAQPEWVICRIHQKSWENRNAMEAAKCGFESQRQMHTNLNLDVFPVQPNCFHFQQHVQLDEDANCSWMENEYHECLGVETDMDSAVLPFSPFHHHMGMGASHPQQYWPPYFI